MMKCRVIELTCFNLLHNSLYSALEPRLCTKGLTLLFNSYVCMHFYPMLLWAEPGGHTCTGSPCPTYLHLLRSVNFAEQTVFCVLSEGLHDTTIHM